MNIISLVSYPFLPAKSGGQKRIACFINIFQSIIGNLFAQKKITRHLPKDMTLLNCLSDSRIRYINLLYFFRLRKIIREKKATHLILEHPYYGWLGILLKKFCGVKLIVHSHNIEGIDGKAWENGGGVYYGIMKDIPTGRRIIIFLFQDADKQLGDPGIWIEAERCLTVSFGTEISAPPRSGRSSAHAGIRCSSNIPYHRMFRFYYQWRISLWSQPGSAGKSGFSYQSPFAKQGILLSYPDFRNGYSGEIIKTILSRCTFSRIM